MFGATFDKYCCSFIDKVLKVHDDQQFEFDSMKKIAQPEVLETDEDLEKFVWNTNAMFEEMKTFIIEES